MILDVRINNFMAFPNDVELSLKADMRTKRFSENVYQSHGFNVVKSACIYGPNNMGKTSIIEALYCIFSVLSRKGFPSSNGKIRNLFSGSNEIRLGITFMYKDEVYSFDFGYIEPDEDVKTGRFTYEKLSSCKMNSAGKVMTETLIYERSPEHCQFMDNSEVSDMISKLADSYNNIALYVLKPELDPNISKYINVIEGFLNSVFIISAPETLPFKTIEELRKGDKGYGKDIVDMIVKADAEISDYTFDDTRDNPLLDKVRENDRNTGSSTKQRDELYCLFSKHNGEYLPSIVYDSKGTRMIAAIAGFVVDALHNDKTLIVDEIDSGLHSSIIRAIVSMFNNETNNAGQLIFTTHDTTLLDTKSLFRKDQIWFMDRERLEDDDDGYTTKRYLYCLDEFTSLEDGVRAETNIEQLYREGFFGAIPEPDFFDVMENIWESRNEQN